MENLKESQENNKISSLNIDNTKKPKLEKNQTQQVQTSVKSVILKPKLGLIRSSTLFLAGIGFAGVMCYSSILSYIKRSDDNIKKELDSLKSLIEKQQVLTIENNNKL